MDAEKVAFLFDDLPGGADPEDPDERGQLLIGRIDPDQPGATLQNTVREVIASQIADDDPPEVWRTARRLLAAGLDRESVLRQLALCFTPTLMAALDDDTPFEEADYLAALERLPLPSGEQIEQSLIDIVRTHRALPFDELDQLLGDRLGVSVDDPVVELLLDRVEQHVIDQHGPLELLAGDDVVHVETLTDDMVLTHELTPQERDNDLLLLAADLHGFRRRADVTLENGASVSVTPGAWVGPTGWLSDVPPYGVVAVHLRDGRVSCTHLTTPPAADDAIVKLLRSAYDRAVAEPWLPVPVEELLLQVRVMDPTAFATPTAPVSTLLAAAGLEVRDIEVAHDESVWQNARQGSRMFRLMNQLDGELLSEVTEVLNSLDEAQLDAAAARRALALFHDPALLEVVADELIGGEDDPQQVERAAALVPRLLAAAARPGHQAVAHWLAAVLAEREGRVEDAEASLRSAVRAEPSWGPAVDRLAWYHSDRGDAETALNLWRGVGATATNSDDVRTLESLVIPAARLPGRNEPCWCGSGRKFKQCHLGQRALPPLPERVGWLCRKAAAFLERRGDHTSNVVYEHAAARAQDPTSRESLAHALADPMVIDVVLHEGGWFDRFLDERGSLLPGDEELLGRAWTLVDRTVYEIVDVQPGAGVQVRDLRTGDVLDVRERTFSRAARKGSLLCARAVPDGKTHQFVGGLFTVPPGRERSLLDVLDGEDGFELLEWIAALERPPVLVGPDGDVLDLDHLPEIPVSDVAPSDAGVQEAMLAFIEQHEQQWCEEPVPALGGVTPLEAAGDPTRRAEVERLIDSFPPADFSTGVFSLRPEKLRERLGLPAG
ncbi:MAG: hypothetical protein EPN99_07460 [Frankiales bacterium]|nr:MAG: hypothetical protein EPN99_07460 [Frankiales bacterium]